MRDSSMVFADGKLQLAGAALFGDVFRRRRGESAVFVFVVPRYSATGLFEYPSSPSTGLRQRKRRREQGRGGRLIDWQGWPIAPRRTAGHVQSTSRTAPSGESGTIMVMVVFVVRVGSAPRAFANLIRPDRPRK